MDVKKGLAPTLVCAGATVALVALGAAALAQERMEPQTTVEALVVMGHKGPAPEGPQLSYPVTFRDLDLRSDAGKKELTRRVAVTATYVCNKLGGMDTLALKSCRQRALNDGLEGAKEVVHLSRAHGVTWAPGPAWKPPPGMK